MADATDVTDVPSQSEEVPEADPSDFRQMEVNEFSQPAEETEEKAVEDVQDSEMACISEEKDGEEMEKKTTEDDIEDGDKEIELKPAEEEEPVLNLKRPYPNLLAISRLQLEDMSVRELSDIWEETICLNIRFVKEKNGIRKGFMRMKFPTEEETNTVFTKLTEMKVNGKPFVYEIPPGEKAKEEAKEQKERKEKGSQDDYSLYVNNIPQGVNVEEVQALFPSARNVVIPLDEDGQQNQGYAIVECSSLKEAENVLLQGKELKIGENILTFDLISHNAPEDEEDDAEAKRKDRRSRVPKRGRGWYMTRRAQGGRNNKGRNRGRKPGRPDTGHYRGGDGEHDYAGRNRGRPRNRRRSPDRNSPARRRSDDRYRRRDNRLPGRSVDGRDNWNQGGGQNVTAALSQTSELLKGLTSLLGQQMMSPQQQLQSNQQYGGGQSWNMDQNRNFQSSSFDSSMNYTSFDSSPMDDFKYGGDYYSGRKRPMYSDQYRLRDKKMARRGGSNYGVWGGSYRGGYN